MSNSKDVAVYLTQEEAEKFKKFRKFEDIFDALVSNGIFEIKGGKATINFNHLGTIQNIHVERVVYLRKNLTNSVNRT